MVTVVNTIWCTGHLLIELILSVLTVCMHTHTHEENSNWIDGYFDCNDRFTVYTDITTFSCIP